MSPLPYAAYDLLCTSIGSSHPPDSAYDGGAPPVQRSFIEVDLDVLEDTPAHAREVRAQQVDIVKHVRLTRATAGERELARREGLQDHEAARPEGLFATRVHPCPPRRREVYVDEDERVVGGSGRPMMREIIHRGGDGDAVLCREPACLLEAHRRAIDSIDRVPLLSQPHRVASLSFAQREYPSPGREPQCLLNDPAVGRRTVDEGVGRIAFVPGDHGAIHPHFLKIVAPSFEARKS